MSEVAGGVRRTPDDCPGDTCLICDLESYAWGYRDFRVLKDGSHGHHQASWTLELATFKAHRAAEEDLCSLEALVETLPDERSRAMGEHPSSQMHQAGRELRQLSDRELALQRGVPGPRLDVDVDLGPSWDCRGLFGHHPRRRKLSALLRRRLGSLEYSLGLWRLRRTR